MPKQEKWEKIYEEYKKEGNVSIEQIENEWRIKDGEYRKALSNINDSNSEEYKKLARKQKREKRQFNDKKNSISKYENIKKNEGKIEKTKEHRDRHQDLLDEIFSSRAEKEKREQDITKLEKEANKLEEELKELKYIEEHLNYALKNPNVSEEMKAEIAIRRKENLEKQNENNAAFSKNQKALEEKIKTPIKEYQEDIDNLKGIIEKDNKICEMLVEGKTMGEIQVTIKALKRSSEQENRKIFSDSSKRKMAKEEEFKNNQPKEYSEEEEKKQTKPTEFPFSERGREYLDKIEVCENASELENIKYSLEFDTFKSLLDRIDKKEYSEILKALEEKKNELEKQNIKPEPKENKKTEEDLEWEEYKKNNGFADNKKKMEQDEMTKGWEEFENNQPKEYSEEEERKQIVKEYREYRKSQQTKEPPKQDPPKQEIWRIDIDEATGTLKLIDANNKEIFNDNMYGYFDVLKKNNPEKYDSCINMGDELLAECRDEFNIDEINIDERVLFILLEKGSKDIALQYCRSICDKEEAIPFYLNYDLRDIYNTDMTLDEIKDINKLANIAKKQNKADVQVTKDNIVKRALGNIKMRYKEGKLLFLPSPDPDVRAQKKEERKAKREERKEDRQQRREERKRDRQQRKEDRSATQSDDRSKYGYDIDDNDELKFDPYDDDELKFDTFDIDELEFDTDDNSEFMQNGDESKVSEEEIDNIPEDNQSDNDVRSRLKVDNGDNHIEANAQEAVESKTQGQNNHEKEGSKGYIEGEDFVTGYDEDGEEYLH